MAKVSSLRVALFVEGSESPAPARETRSSLERLWNERLCQALGLREFSKVVPISKKHLVAMDPDNPPMSGAGERLDQLMARVLAHSPFDAAVIAWDLVPAWNPRDEYCRWQETLDLYRYLSERDGLAESWRRRAGERFVDLNTRRSPMARHQPPRMAPHTILAVCMEPMFEVLLAQDEAAVKRALGLAGNIPGWPSQGWGDPKELRPDAKLLGPAVHAAQSRKPKAIAGVRGSWRTNKDGWGEFLIHRLLADDKARSQILDHPLCRRLAEIGPR